MSYMKTVLLVLPAFFVCLLAANTGLAGDKIIPGCFHIFTEGIKSPDTGYYNSINVIVNVSDLLDI